MDLDLLIFLDNIHGDTTGCKVSHWGLKNRLRGEIKTPMWYPFQQSEAITIDTYRKKEV